MSDQTMHALARDLARLGMEQYDTGFDACVELVTRLAGRGISLPQILITLMEIQYDRPDITARVAAQVPL